MWENNCVDIDEPKGLYVYDGAIWLSTVIERPVGVKTFAETEDDRRPVER